MENDKKTSNCVNTNETEISKEWDIDTKEFENAVNKFVKKYADKIAGFIILRNDKQPYKIVPMMDGEFHKKVFNLE